jgi:hypothetical protein
LIVPMLGPLIAAVIIAAISSAISAAVTIPAAIAIILTGPISVLLLALRTAVLALRPVLLRRTLLALRRALLLRALLLRAAFRRGWGYGLRLRRGDRLRGFGSWGGLGLGFRSRRFNDSRRGRGDVQG